MAATQSIRKGPLSDVIITAISRLVDDSFARREPSHSDLDFHIKKCSLEIADPKLQGQAVGKAKRIRAVLSWSYENNIDAGEKLVYALISLIRALGGFRVTSTNYVGEDNIINAQIAFKEEGYELTNDGELRQIVLDQLSETVFEEVIHSYIRRAKKGVEDAALLTGTGKDLIEAVCGYILLKLYGDYPKTANFPTLLGQVYIALELSPQIKEDNVLRRANVRFEAALYELACSINMLRNKEGTGHGRPFLTSITSVDAKASIESIGMIAEFLLEIFYKEHLNKNSK